MNARHEWELTPLSYTVAHFDYMQRGLGNASCGPGTISEYQCPSSGTYSYKLRMTSAAKSLNTAIRPQTTTEKIKVVYQRENNSVKCQGTIEANSAICLLDVSGKLIDQHFMPAEAIDVEFTMSGASKGTYIILIKDSKGMKSYKFMKTS